MGSNPEYLEKSTDSQPEKSHISQMKTGRSLPRPPTLVKLLAGTMNENSMTD